MFDRPRHRVIATVLDALDADLLARNRCYFGGGTAIVLRCGEYRESFDIDFLVTGSAGVNALSRGPELRALRPVRADQYGLRTFLEYDDGPIKFEIIFEGHLDLAIPSADERVCGIATLARVDAAACELLANADRWADPSVFSRDVIDLAMLQAPDDVFDAAVDKATRAYGHSVVRCLNSAVTNLCGDSDNLAHAMASLTVTVPADVLRQRLEALRR